NDYDEAHKNLKDAGYKVDYIITHTTDSKALLYPPLSGHYKPETHTNRMLANFEAMIDYKHWYFGHYHTDARITEKKTALYNTVILL
ncbi:MAG: serine/threonine protein phosphatase, partial [Firmicutes bacterium]|nr:serine/threonine protein phosphatase [Bacillota bacterium]